jgi:hypothetical protein
MVTGAKLLVPSALLAVFLLAAGSAFGSRQTPSMLAKHVIEEWTTGSPERAWDSLHPAHQRVVSRKKFSYCVRGGRGEQKRRVTVAVSGEQRIAVARTEIAQHHGWRVRMLVTYQTGNFKSRDQWSLDVVPVRHHWRWLLDRSFVDQYRRFRHQPKVCPE